MNDLGRISSDLLLSGLTPRRAGSEQDCTYRDDITRRVRARGLAPGRLGCQSSLSVVVGETEAIALGKGRVPGQAEQPRVGASFEVGIVGRGPQRPRISRGGRGCGWQPVSRRRCKPRGLLAGTPEMIADYMVGWFTAGACNGFVLPPTVYPGTDEEFGRLVCRNCCRAVRPVPSTPVPLSAWRRSGRSSLLISSLWRGSCFVSPSLPATWARTQRR